MCTVKDKRKIQQATKNFVGLHNQFDWLPKVEKGAKWLILYIFKVAYNHVSLPLDFHVLKDHWVLEECEQHLLYIFFYLGEWDSCFHNITTRHQTQQQWNQ